MYELLEWVSYHVGECLSFLLLMCAVLCLMNWRLSRWLLLAMVGFLASAFFLFGCSYGMRVLYVNGLLGHGIYRLIEQVMSLFFLLSFGVMVAGLALTFAALQRRLARPREASDHTRELMAAPGVLEPRLPRREGRQDIQK